MSREEFNIRVVGARLYLLPVQTRVPLKFGSETLTSVTCLRAALTVEGADGRRSTGWGGLPLSIQWGWPSTTLTYVERYDCLIQFCRELTSLWGTTFGFGHALDIGHLITSLLLPDLLEDANRKREPNSEPIPWLAALICCSPFDQALHDAYGVHYSVPTYETYQPPFTFYYLSQYLKAGSRKVSFAGKYPHDYLTPRQNTLRAWHLVGGLDALDESELTGDEPDDGYPVTLIDWIARDGLNCLKIKLRGTDSDWDYDRIVHVGRIALTRNVEWLSVDFNCTVTDPEYVNDILDRLERDQPAIHRIVLYVEQPFPYELENHVIDVHSLAARKPLFMDESAHDWTHIRMGRARGWNGVALKTCKTQTGAILSLCWAKAHGMDLMVQDLTNPMLAMIPHALLAAHAGTIMGIETNAPQFYPEASQPEAKTHPGLYTRRNGSVDLSSIRGPGFGYRLNEIDRDLHPPNFCSE